MKCFIVDKTCTILLMLCKTFFKLNFLSTSTLRFYRAIHEEIYMSNNHITDEIHFTACS